MRAPHNDKTEGRDSSRPEHAPFAGQRAWQQGPKGSRATIAAAGLWGAATGHPWPWRRCSTGKRKPRRSPADRYGSRGAHRGISRGLDSGGTEGGWLGSAGGRARSVMMLRINVSTAFSSKASIVPSPSDEPCRRCASTIFALFEAGREGGFDERFSRLGRRAGEKRRPIEQTLQVHRRQTIHFRLEFSLLPSEFIQAVGFFAAQAHSDAQPPAADSLSSSPLELCPPQQCRTLCRSIAARDTPSRHNHQARTPLPAYRDSPGPSRCRGKAQGCLVLD
jgi:hypothetical protein